jgi:membrane-associated phospholipid phosphatase
MAHWVSIRLVKRLWQQFWQEARQLPAAAWRRWAGTLALGLGGVAPVAFGLTRYAQAAEQSWLRAWDEAWLVRIAEAAPITFAKAITWESPGNLLIALPILLAFAGLMVWRSRPLIAATTLAAYVLQFALVWIGWGLWPRQRPALIAEGIAASSLHSFPSGHTVLVLSVYGFVAYLWLRAAASWIEQLGVLLGFVGFASLVIVARLVLGAHWPSDVLAGLIIGGLWLGVVIIAFEHAAAASSAAAAKPTAWRPKLR